MNLHFRAAQQIGVSFPKRIIELIVMPYESETLVREDGRVFQEIVSRGAFDGIERRTSQVRVNRDHDVRRLVGKAIALHPSRREGLVAELRISRTELGDETLTLADDEVLDASAGFALLMDEKGRVKPNAEVWETRTRKRLNHLFLGHIALVPEPAYEDARVLAVRHSDGAQAERATPNLDALELRRLQAVYAAIDARYSLQ